MSENNVKPRDVSDIDREVGERIVNIRLSLGISRRDLADKVSVSHQQLEKYEVGRNRISVGRLAEIAEALDIPIAYLFKKTDILFDPSIDTKQRASAELLKDFLAIKDERQKKALRDIIKTLGKV